MSQSVLETLEILWISKHKNTNSTIEWKFGTQFLELAILRNLVDKHRVRLLTLLLPTEFETCPQKIKVAYTIQLLMGNVFVQLLIFNSWFCSIVIILVMVERINKLWAAHKVPQILQGRENRNWSVLNKDINLPMEEWMPWKQQSADSPSSILFQKD